MINTIRKLFQKNIVQSEIIDQDDYKLLEDSIFFDEKYYLKNNPKLNINPISDYLIHGWKENKNPSCFFNTRYYLEQNPDVQQSGMNPLIHFLKFGINENRKTTPLFDLEYYLSNNPDLGNLQIHPLLHFIELGYNEGRKPNPIFDTKYYQAHNKNIKTNPLEHYLKDGEKEGRKPSEYFDPKYYQKNYGELITPEQGLMEHFLTSGWKKGLNQVPFVNYSLYFTAQSPEQKSYEVLGDFYDKILITKPQKYISYERRLFEESELQHLYQEDHCKLNIKELNFFGYLNSISGLGQSSRSLLEAISKTGFKFNSYPMPTLDHQESLNKYQIDQETSENSISIAHINLDSIPAFYEIYSSYFIKTKYRITHFVWELTSYPSDWTINLASLDEIWVPSNFCKNTVEAITNKKVTLVPYTINLPKNDARPEDIIVFKEKYQIPDNCFIYLFIFDATSYIERKNPIALIKAFSDFLSVNSDVLLILKISYSLLEQIKISELYSLISTIPKGKVIIIEEILSDKNLSILFNLCHAYVSPHCSEGFGMTLAEALSYQKPVITTDYSATKDFINEENAYPVSYKLIELQHDLGYHYRKGSIWAQINHDHLVARMQEVYNDYETAKSKALKGFNFIRDNYSSEHIAELIRKRISNI